MQSNLDIIFNHLFPLVVFALWLEYKYNTHGQVSIVWFPKTSAGGNRLVWF